MNKYHNNNLFPIWTFSDTYLQMRTNKTYTTTIPWILISSTPYRPLYGPLTIPDSLFGNTLLLRFGEKKKLDHKQCFMVSISSERVKFIKTKRITARSHYILVNEREKNEGKASSQSRQLEETVEI